MCRPALVWGGILAAGIAAEAHALRAGHHDCTLSALTRRVCHTQRPAGRVAFVLGSYALAGWFVHHIISRKENP
jgi:hypothetical protein